MHLDAGGDAVSDLAFRAHTWDENIWKSVALHNEYGLAAGFRFSADDVILDIGAHIGSFSYLALDRGAGKVFCVEPDPGNFLYLRHNLHAACGATDRAVCISAAAWRSDVPSGVVHYAAVGSNTGGGNSLGDSGLPVCALSLDALAALAASASKNGRLRLVKLDCEGSEWPILYTAHVYGIVDAFIGEYHMLDRAAWPHLELAHEATPEALGEFFRSLGYEFASVDTGGGMGKFRAWRLGQEV